ncbi:hypothetical protein ACO0OL_002681 [Hanseniaspora opuntiae]
MQSQLEQLLSKFKYIKTLQEDEVSKTSTIFGYIPLNGEKEVSKDNRALLHINNQILSADKILEFINIRNTKDNDCYHWGEGSLKIKDDVSPYKLNLIYPASDKHLSKYDYKNRNFQVIETPELYRNVVKPYIDHNIKEGSIQWVYNIIQGKTEQDSIRFDEPDFLVLPDMKWTDETDLKNMYLLLLFKDYKFTSIREFCTEEHLTMLKNVKTFVEKKILAKYGNTSIDKVKMYFHYQPSYYQLHLHIVHADNEVNYKSMLLGKDCHFLDTVINNMEMMIDYYQKCNMVYYLTDTSELYKRLNEAM